MPKVFNTLASAELVKMLIGGAVGVIPTDTVYGLVCRAADKTAVAKLYKLKQRQAKPGTIISASIDQLTELGIKRSYLKAVEQFWPGGVSIVVPFSDPVGDYLRQGKVDIAVRIPDDKDLCTLLTKTDTLLTTSANLPDQPLATNLKAAQKYFGDKVDFYVNGGDLSDRQPSTIIKVIDDAVEVLRQGAVKIENNGVIK